LCAICVEGTGLDVILALTFHIYCLEGT
jgi:hypothetical protein